MENGRSGSTFYEICNKMGGMIDLRCYQALLEIKEILEDDALTDAECFTHIEKVICVFEKLGSGIAGRHDF